MSQNQQVLEHMRARGSITSYEAFSLYGITRLSGRIYELTKEGNKIKSELCTNGKSHFSKYSLEVDNERNQIS